MNRDFPSEVITDSYLNTRALLDISDYYSSPVRSWIRWMEETGESVTEAGIKAYFRWLNEESGLAAATIRVRRLAVKKRVKQLFQDVPIETRMRISHFLTEIESEHGIKAPKKNTDAVAHEQALEISEYQKCLENASTARQRSFLQFLWVTGCRVSEMCTIRLDQCLVDGKIVKIRIMGKGQKERIIRIPREFFTELTRLYTGTTYLFETAGGKRYDRSYVSKEITKVGKRMKKKISAHTLRHSFATRMIAAGKSVKAVSTYLGHSSTAITQDMYVHDELRDEDLFPVC